MTDLWECALCDEHKHSRRSVYLKHTVKHVRTQVNTDRSTFRADACVILFTRNQGPVKHPPASSRGRGAGYDSSQ